MNVLLVTGPMTAAAQERLQGEASRLADSGIEARILCTEAPDVPGGEFEIRECPGLSQRWRCDWEIRRLGWLREPRIELVHVLDFALAEVGLALSQHLACPYLLSVDEFLPPGTPVRLSRRWFRGILASGRDLADDLSATLPLPPSLIRVIPPGLPVLDFGNPHMPTADVVGVVGVGPHPGDGAGMLTFFRAARLLVDRGLDAEFVVAGPVGEEAELRRMVTHLRLTERTTFAEPWTVGAAFWSVFRAYCRSSWQPTAGLEVVEAMAHGIPVAVSDVPGLRSWVQPGETGLLVPPGDPAALATALGTILGDPEHAAELGASAARWVATHCDPARRARTLVEIYEEAIPGAAHVGLTNGTAGEPGDMNGIPQVGGPANR